MANLSESQLGTVRLLVQAASDRAIHDLEAALAAGGDRHESMRAIQRMVAAEATDRAARDMVLAPIIPLCSPRDTPGGLRFPRQAMTRLWGGIAEQSPKVVQSIVLAIHRCSAESLPTADFDALCLDAAKGLRERSNPGYAAAADALDRSGPEAAAAFAACLDLAPVVRAALQKLPEWLGRLTEERAAAARVAFHDATRESDDAGPVFLEILYTHLPEPWTVLRLVSAVMHRPADRYVATSELSGFGERLLDDIDQRLKLVASLDADGGVAAGVAAGQSVRTAAQMISEFGDCLEMAPDGPWGSRLFRQKRTLAAAIESRLKACEGQVALALPLQSTGFRKGARGQPRLQQDPDVRQVERARALLGFMHEIRTCAERLGFGSAWTKAYEGLDARLGTYVEDLLEKLRNPEEAENYPRIRLYLDVAAELMGLAADDKAAQIVRRRMAAAA